MAEKKGGISDKLRLKEMAEEDIYFARRDRERIEALHEGESAEQQDDEADQDRKKDVAPDFADQKPQLSRGIIKHCRRLVRKLLGSEKQ